MVYFLKETDQKSEKSPKPGYFFQEGILRKIFLLFSSKSEALFLKKCIIQPGLICLQVEAGGKRGKAFAVETQPDGQDAVNVPPD